MFILFKCCVIFCRNIRYDAVSNQNGYKNLLKKKKETKNEYPDREFKTNDRY